MKSVVMIAYHFPPEGNAGAHRPLRFVRHLPSKGWQPTVITAATDFYERYDSKLLDSVPLEVTVIRVRNPDPWQRFQQCRAKRLQRTISVVTPERARDIQPTHQHPPPTSLLWPVR